MTISTIGVAHPSTDRLIAGMLILIMPQLLNAIPEPGELEIEPPNLQSTPPIELPPDSPAPPEVPPQQPPAQPQRPPQMKPELGNIAGVVPDSKRLAYEMAKPTTRAISVAAFKHAFEARFASRETLSLNDSFRNSHTLLGNRSGLSSFAPRQKF